jgi:RNA polymerase sigma factor (TIGR02999 family)
MQDPRGEVTRLLQSGDRGGLFDLVYDELRVIASRRMARERTGHTLQATALIHETYIRLVADDEASWEERRHFYATASEAMRRILIEHARKVGAEKRGGAAQRVTFGGVDTPIELDLEQVGALHEALDRLEQEDERAASVTRLRFLAGLSVEETAKALSISIRSVRREWTFARARLFELLGL